MRIFFGNITLDLNIFNIRFQLTNSHDEPLYVNLIETLSNEHLEKEFFVELDSLVNEILFSDMLDELSTLCLPHDGNFQQNRCLLNHEFSYDYQLNIQLSLRRRPCRVISSTLS